MGKAVYSRYFSICDIATITCGMENCEADHAILTWAELLLVLLTSEFLTAVMQCYYRRHSRRRFWQGF